MLVKLIKNTLCLVIATVAFNAHAVFIAEVDTTSYEWLTINHTGSLDQVSKEGTTNRSTLYEYEYTSRELQNDVTQSYTPWRNVDEWYGASTFDSASVTARELNSNEGVNGKESVSVRVLLLIISGLIGVFGLTKDRSHE